MKFSPGLSNNKNCTHFDGWSFTLWYLLTTKLQQISPSAAGLIKAPIGKLHPTEKVTKIASSGKSVKKCIQRKKWEARGGADTSAAAINRQSLMHQPKPQHFLFALKFQIEVARYEAGSPVPQCRGEWGQGGGWYHPMPIWLKTQDFGTKPRLPRTKVPLILLKTLATLILPSKDPDSAAIKKLQSWLLVILPWWMDATTHPI